MSGKAEHKVYSYVVAWDGGFAPNLDGGVCTLCLCKPVIRRTAQCGDWIVGLWPKRRGRYCLTYVMQVSRKLTMQEYSVCEEFDHKRPGQSNTPDNIYEFDPPPLRRRPGTDFHNSPGEMQRDLNGKYALVANRFWYFGRTRCELPDEFRKLDIPDPRRGHSVSWLGDAELASFVAWLDSRNQVVKTGAFSSHGSSRFSSTPSTADRTSCSTPTASRRPIGGC